VKGLGIHCSFVQGRPRVVGVTVERNAAGALQAAQAFSHTADAQEAFPLQLANLKSAIATHLHNQQVDAAVVRAMDFFGNTNRARLQRHAVVTGILVAESRGRFELTQIMSGREAAAEYGCTKEQLENEAAGLLNADLKEAGGAALAALHLAENP
jgi:hypothetical protein